MGSETMVTDSEVVEMMRRSVAEVRTVDEWTVRAYVDGLVERGGEREQSEQSEQGARSTVEVLRAADGVLGHPQYGELDAGYVIVDLVGAVLERLTMEEILRVYPTEAILTAVRSPAAQMAKMAMRIVEVKADDDGTRQFVESSGFVRTVLELYLREEDTPVAVLASVESLIHSIVARRPQWARELVGDEHTATLMRTARGDASGTLVARLLDFVLAVIPAFSAEMDHNDVPALLYVFDEHEIRENEDPLLVVLVIQFYARLIQQLQKSYKPAVFEEIKPCIRSLAELYAARTSDPVVESYYANEIVEVMRVLSVCPVADMFQFAVQVIKQFGLSQPYNLSLTVYESDLRMFSTWNPSVIGTREFLEVMQEVPVLHKRYVPILLNALRSGEIFARLVEARKLTIEGFGRFSKDILYLVLHEFSRHDYAIEHLVHNMPTIISKFLVDNPNDLIEPEIWTLRKDTLHNLLHSDVDLMYWRDSLAKSYRLMVGGRSYVDIEPAVDVASDFGQ